MQNVKNNRTWTIELHRPRGGKRKMAISLDMAAIKRRRRKLFSSARAAARRAMEGAKDRWQHLARR